MQTWRWAVFAAAACGVLASSPRAAMAACSGSYAIDLTVELSPELTQGQNNILIELRQGVVGSSRVFETRQFVGHFGTVVFSRMCAGSYFIAIGNGETVAVGPVRRFSDNQRIHTKVRVSFSQGNVGTMSRSSL